MAKTSDRVYTCSNLGCNRQGAGTYTIDNRQYRFCSKCSQAITNNFLEQMYKDYFRYWRV